MADSSKTAAVDPKLKRQQQRIDKSMLGLTDDVLGVLKLHDNADSAQSALKALFARTAIEWQSLKQEHSVESEAEFECVGCSAGQQCAVWKRALFVAELFKEHFLSPLIYVDADSEVKMDNVLYVDLFAQCLSGHSVVSLLDDYHHIQSMHGDGRNAVECDCTESERECAGDLMRKYRERERGDDHGDDSKTENEVTVFGQYLDGLDEGERAIMEMTIKLHDALSHCADEEEAVGVDEKEDGDAGKYMVRSLKWWKQRTPQNQTANKFVNEVAEQKEESAQNEGGRMDELSEVLLGSWLKKGVGAKLQGMGQQLDGQRVRVLSFDGQSKLWAVTMLDADRENAENEVPSKYIVVGKSGLCIDDEYIVYYM